MIYRYYPDRTQGSGPVFFKYIWSSYLGTLQANTDCNKLIPTYLELSASPEAWTLWWEVIYHYIYYYIVSYCDKCKICLMQFIKLPLVSISIPALSTLVPQSYDILQLWMVGYFWLLYSLDAPCDRCPATLFYPLQQRAIQGCHRGNDVITLT